MATLDELLSELKDSSVPPEVVRDYFIKTSKTNPEIEKMPAKQIAAGIALAYGAAKSGKFELPKSDTQRVEVTGRKLQDNDIRPQDVSPNIPRSYQAPTEPLDPYKGSGTTPAEILKKQFALADYGSNTERQAAAEEEYRNQLRANNLGRGISGFITGSVAGYDQGRALSNSKAAWDKRDEQAKDTTVGRITREQTFMKNGIDAYKEGVATAGLVLDQAVKSGEFTIKSNEAALTQKKLQLELLGTSAGAQVTQSLLDPLSDNSKAARENTRRKLKLTGLYTDKQIMELVPENAPGVYVAPIGALADDLLKTQKSTAEVGKIEAETGEIGARTSGMTQGQTSRAQENPGLPGPAAARPSVLTPQGARPTNPNVIPPAVQRQRDSDAIPILEEELKKAQAKGNAGDIAALQRELVIARKKAGVDPNDALYGAAKTGQEKAPTSKSYGPHGEMSESPAPYAQNKQNQSAADLNQKQKFLSEYNNTIQDQVGYVYKNSDKFGRTNWLNLTNDPDLVKRRNAINALNSAGEALGLIKPGESNKGAQSAVGAVGGALSGSSNAPGIVAGTALSAAAPLMGGSQPVTDTSPPQVVRDLAVKVSYLKALQEKMLPYERGFAQRNNYNMDGWTETPIYKRITDKNQTVPVVSPDGKVELLDKAEEGKRILDLVKNKGYKLMKDVLGE